MRAVVDTNVLISGLLWHGAPHALLEQARAGVVVLVTSPALLAEPSAVVMRQKFRATLAKAAVDPGQMLAAPRRLAEIVDPPALPERRSRDPDDDAVLALGIAARADMIVSGDADLLVLGSHAGIPIVTTIEALGLIAAARA